MEILPSDEAQPRIKPYSCGAQAIELTIISKIKIFICK